MAQIPCDILVLRRSLTISRATPLVLFFHLAPAFIIRHSKSTFASGFLVGERNVWKTRRVTWHLARIRVTTYRLHNCRLLISRLFSVFEYLLFNHFLLENLVVKLQRLPVDKIVVKAFAISRLNYIALGVYTVLVTLLRRNLVLTFELFFLLYRVGVMGNKTCGRCHHKLAYPTIIQLINSLVESLTINALSVSQKLLVSLLKLLLKCPCLTLKLVIVISVLRVAIDIKILHKRVFKWSLVTWPNFNLDYFIILSSICRLFLRSPSRCHVPGWALPFVINTFLLWFATSAIKLINLTGTSSLVGITSSLLGCCLVNFIASFYKSSESVIFNFNRSSFIQNWLSFSSLCFQCKQVLLQLMNGMQIGDEVGDCISKRLSLDLLHSDSCL